MTAIEPREWRLWLGLADPPLSLNDRHKHWSHRDRWARKLRAIVKRECEALDVPALDRPIVELHLIPRRIGRDADNIVATAKPCVDGLVDAGVIRDDRPDYVDHRMPVLDPSSSDVALTRAGELGRGRLYLLIRENPEHTR